MDRMSKAKTLEVESMRQLLQQRERDLPRQFNLEIATRLLYIQTDIITELKEMEA